MIQLIQRKQKVNTKAKCWVWVLDKLLQSVCDKLSSKAHQIKWNNFSLYLCPSSKRMWGCKVRHHFWDMRYFFSIHLFTLTGLIFWLTKFVNGVYSYYWKMKTMFCVCWIWRDEHHLLNDLEANLNLKRKENLSKSLWLWSI